MEPLSCVLVMSSSRSSVPACSLLPSAALLRFDFSYSSSNLYQLVITFPSALALFGTNCSLFCSITVYFIFFWCLTFFFSCILKCTVLLFKEWFCPLVLLLFFFFFFKCHLFFLSPLPQDIKCSWFVTYVIVLIFLI